ncbi:MAG: heavy metal translocating P-type ATPase [Tissierellia bacterium]|nr:heavy metal translocating P-type ATPase [Tissierellia bacterium]
MDQRYHLNHLSCPVCTTKILDSIDAWEDVSVDRYDIADGLLILKQNSEEDLTERLQELADSIEPGVEVSRDAVVAPPKLPVTQILALVGQGLLLPLLVFLGQRGIFAQDLVTGLSFLLILWVGREVFMAAVRGIPRGDIFNENLLMGVASLAAVGIGEVYEGMMILIFYQVGEILQDYAVDVSRARIAGLLSTGPKRPAHKIQGDDVIELPPEELQVGDLIFVKVGESVPVDGALEGSGIFSQAQLTGESRPVELSDGGHVASGSVVLSAPVLLRVTAVEDQSEMARIEKMMDEARGKKAKVETWIQSFARIYTPIVVLGGALTALVPPLFFGGDWHSWIYRGAAFLIISCPCAMILSIPLSLVTAMGRASQGGVYLKGADRLEALSKVDTVALDKTGTITLGRPQVISVDGDERMVALAKGLEAGSNHPLAGAILSLEGPAAKVTELEEIPGKGMSGRYQGKKVILGTPDWIRSLHPHYVDEGQDTAVVVATEDEVLGSIHFGDELKPHSREVFEALKKYRPMILSGDRQGAVDALATTLGAKGMGGMRPQEKLSLVHDLETSGHRVLFVGDGINDGPVLSRASMSLAMGLEGSDLAMEAADGVLLSPDLRGIPMVLGLARRTKATVLGQFTFALGAKLLILLLTFVGLGDLWLAVFADVGVALICVLISMSLLRYQK